MPSSKTTYDDLSTEDICQNGIHQPDPTSESETNYSPTSISPSSSPSQSPEPLPCCSDQQKQRPAKYNNFHTTFTFVVTTHTSSIRYPLSSVISYDRLSSSHHSFVVSIFSNVEPKSYTKVVKYDCWVKAMQQELTALELNHTWVLTDLVFA